MKNFIILSMIMVGLLFTSQSASAQENVNLEFPMNNIYSFVKRDRSSLHFTFKITANIGGESFEGSTAFDMLLSAVYQQPYYGYLAFEGEWEVTKNDGKFLYGHAIIYITPYMPESVKTITITRVENGPVVVNRYDG